MVEFTLPDEMTEEFLAKIPRQRQKNQPFDGDGKNYVVRPFVRSDQALVRYQSRYRISRFGNSFAVSVD